MLKVNIRVLVSFLCILFSCVLTWVCLFVVDEDKVLTETINTNDALTTTTLSNDIKVEEVSVSEVNNIKEDENINTNDNNETDNLESVNNTIVEPVVEPEKVYEGMTLDELANKLDRSLKNELHGKGYLYASYSLEKGVDPYLAAAISLEETGCNWNCSNLVKSCNNVGGMKGSGCGSYGAFSTLDDGIRAFIDNISRNYVAYGLTTADLMNPKYAENPAWSNNVNNYITRIRNN